MVKAITGVFLALISSSGFAKDVYVQGHVTKSGTYVSPHYRSAPDSTPLNNYGTQGNYNPYTGNSGTVNPYNSFSVQQPIISAPVYPSYQAPAPSYYSPYGR